MNINRHRRFSDHISDAIDAHGRWRLTLRRAINGGKIEFSPEQVRDDRACTVGSWLHGPDIDPAIRELPAWNAISGLHKEFHEVAAEVLVLVQQGQIEAADRLMAGEYLIQSKKLIAALEKWRADVSLRRT